MLTVKMLKSIWYMKNIDPQKIIQDFRAILIHDNFCNNKFLGDIVSATLLSEKLK